MAEDKEIINETPIEDGIELRTVENTMEDYFLRYSLSVIVDRALPDVRDGLKPSAVCEDIVRRCLAIDSKLRVVVYQNVHSTERDACGGEFFPILFGQRSGFHTAVFNKGFHGQQTRRQLFFRHFQR